MSEGYPELFSAGPPSEQEVTSQGLADCFKPVLSRSLNMKLFVTAGEEISMRQKTGIQTETSAINKRPFFCEHHFHVIHVAERIIPGVMICESCGQRLVLRRKQPPISCRAKKSGM